MTAGVERKRIRGILEPEVEATSPMGYREHGRGDYARVDRARRRDGAASGDTMPKTGTIFAILTLFTLTFAGCMTMSDEERCKKEGGVWNNKMCERQAK